LLSVLLAFALMGALAGTAAADTAAPADAATPVTSDTTAPGADTSTDAPSGSAVDGSGTEATEVPPPDDTASGPVPSGSDWSPDSPGETSPPPTTTDPPPAGAGTTTPTTPTTGDSTTTTPPTPSEPSTSATTTPPATSSQSTSASAARQPAPSHQAPSPVAAPAPSSLAPATSPAPPVAVATAATGQPAAPPAARRHRERPAAAPHAPPPVRALLAAGDGAGLLPFGSHGVAEVAPLALPVAAAASSRAPARTGAGTIRRDPRAPAPHDGGGRHPAPDGPPGRPGGAGAGGIGTASGGAAAGVWCAILLGAFFLIARELRRHCVRLVIPAPRGVELLLQRPG
jgi:hypothetical protein